MKRDFDRAVKVAAKMKACESYCQRHPIPDPDFEPPEVDPQVIELHGQALAWAERCFTSMPSPTGPLRGIWLPRAS
jgi:hypothetical protein